MTGYVINIIKERSEVNWRLEVTDTYHRVTNTFLTETITTPENAMSSKHWATQILNETGISYDITEEGLNVAPGVELGLRTAHEALFDICTYSSWYAYPNPVGTLHVGPLTTGTVPITHTFTTGTNLKEFERVQSDEQTRNVIKVYGAGGLGPTGSGRIF